MDPICFLRLTLILVLFLLQVSGSDERFLILLHALVLVGELYYCLFGLFIQNITCFVYTEILENNEFAVSEEIAEIRNF
jgi:hypothetical protein